MIRRQKRTTPGPKTLRTKWVLPLHGCMMRILFMGIWQLRILWRETTSQTPRPPTSWYVTYIFKTQVLSAVVWQRIFVGWNESVFISIQSSCFISWFMTEVMFYKYEIYMHDESFCAWKIIYGFHIVSIYKDSAEGLDSYLLHISFMMYSCFKPWSKRP